MPANTDQNRAEFRTGSFDLGTTDNVRTRFPTDQIGNECTGEHEQPLGMYIAYMRLS